MMFQGSMAFALALIALALGYWVLDKVQGQEKTNIKAFGTFLGFFIIILAFITVLCSGYYSLRYWEDGYFNGPRFSKMEMMHSGGMMMGQMHGSHNMMMGDGGMHNEQCARMMSQEKTCTKKGKMMHGNMSEDMNCDKNMDMKMDHDGMQSKHMMGEDGE